MRPGALSRLVEAARALPGDAAAGAAPWSERLAPPELRALQLVDGELPDIADLRRRLGRLLEEMGRRLEPALSAALGRAARAWDQVDALTVFDVELGGTVAEIRRDAERLRRCEDAAIAAAGLEALVTLSAATGLVALFERRLATLVRLRLRAGGDLLVDGRPFLDLAAALTAAARGFS